jgi:hypothetical protein
MTDTQIHEVVTVFHAVGYCNAEDLLLLLFSKPLIKFLILFSWILSTSCYLDRELFVLQVSFVRILGKFSSHFPEFLDCHRAPSCDLFCSFFFFYDLPIRNHSSNFLLFADDLKMHLIITSAEGCKSLQTLKLIRCKSGLLKIIWELKTKN